MRQIDRITAIGGRAGLLSARCDVVRLEDGTLAVLKDFSKLPLPVRMTVGRVAAGRERRAYERLAGLAGIPRLIDVPGPFALVLEYIAGRPPTDAGAVGNPEVFVARLEALLACVHARGVAHGEIRLANVLVDVDDDPWLVDFATASIAGAAGGGPLFRTQKRLDRYGWLMIKKHMVPGSLTPGERDEERRARLLAAVFRHNVT